MICHLTRNDSPSIVPLHQRGPLVAAAKRDLPDQVRRGIDLYVRLLAGLTIRHSVSLERDVLGLLGSPAVRSYVAVRPSDVDEVRWAAVASCFVAEVRDQSPSLYGRYVCCLVPQVARAAASVVNLFRMGSHNEFRRAVKGRRQDQDRLSWLGPMALFFLESVGRAQVAWDVLVEPGQTPAAPRAFGWAPGVDSLAAAMRFILLGQAGRQLRRKALLASPLAACLKGMGMVHAVGNPAAETEGRGRDWLLSTEHLMHAAGAAERVLFLDESAGAARWVSEEATVDGRTGRRAAAPQEELELAEARSQLLGVTRALIGRYAEYPHRQLKRLALWAYVAEVDPAALLSPPELLDETVLSSLAEAAIRRRTRRCSLDDLNALLQGLDSEEGGSAGAALSSAQSRTYLSRLRQEFRSEVDDCFDL